MRNLILLFVFFMPNLCYGQLDKMSRSVCMVSSIHGRGSGVVIKEHDNKYYILTAGHVIDDANAFMIYFSYNGEYTKGIPGKKVFCKFFDGFNIDNREDEDIGLVMINKSDIDVKDGHPTVLKISQKIQDKVFTYGHPHSNWATGYIAKVIENKNNIIVFSPKPMTGRSGSALCNQDAEVIGVVVRADIGNKNNGYAIKINSFLKYLKEQNETLFEIITGE